MATSDIITEFEQYDGVIESSLQEAVRNAVLKQLEDSSIDVQAVAVKCLSILVKKFNQDIILDIVSKLGGLVVKSNESR